MGNRMIQKKDWLYLMCNDANSRRAQDRWRPEAQRQCQCPAVRRMEHILGSPSATLDELRDQGGLMLEPALQEILPILPNSRRA